MQPMHSSHNSHCSNYYLVTSFYSHNEPSLAMSGLAFSVAPIIRLTVVRGRFSSLEICLVERYVFGLSSWLWISSSTAKMCSSVRDDFGQPLPEVRSIESVLLSFRKKSSNVLRFQFLLGNSLISLLEE